MGVASLNLLVLVFTLLQALDYLTTLVGLRHGFVEAMPVARLALHWPGGLFTLKLLALGAGYWLWRMGYRPLIYKVNIAFAAVVAWNLLLLILS